MRVPTTCIGCGRGLDDIQCLSLSQMWQGELHLLRCMVCILCKLQHLAEVNRWTHSQVLALSRSNVTEQHNLNSARSAALVSFSEVHVLDSGNLEALKHPGDMQ